MSEAFLLVSRHDRSDHMDPKIKAQLVQVPMKCMIHLNDYFYIKPPSPGDTISALCTLSVFARERPYLGIL